MSNRITWFKELNTEYLVIRRTGYSNKSLFGTLGILLFLSLWEIFSQTRIVNPSLLPAPSTILAKTIILIDNGVLIKETAVTMSRIMTGFILAIIFGISAAVLSNSFRPFEYFLVPIVEMIRNIAPLALLPAFMLLFGIGFISKVIIILWVAWIPIFLNTLQGIKSVDPIIIKAAKTFGSSKSQIAFKVILPSALPFIIVGLRLGMGSSFLVLVAAELLGTNSGLGYYILEKSQTFKVVEMYSAIFVIALIGMVMNSLFLLITKRLFPWKQLEE